MQILYCDDCGIRIDEGQGQETDLHKVYCGACAPRHAAEFRTQSSKLRPPRGQSGRAPGTGVVRGVQPPGTKAPNLLPPRMDQSAETTQESPRGVGAWLQENKPIAMAGGGAAAVVIVVLIWMLMGSKPQRIVEAPPKLSDKPLIDPTQMEPRPPDKVDPKPPDPKPPEIVPPPKIQFNAVHDKAERDLAAIKAEIKAGTIDGYHARRKLEWFLGPQLSGTPTQAEAKQMIEKYKDEKRAPDKADGAEPGVNARIAFPKGAELFGTDFPPLETRTLKTINFPDATAIRTGFGRDADFAARISGFIEVPKDGTYTFYLSSDDGSQLFIGSTPLINHSGLHGISEKDGYIDLKAGKHKFRVDYFQGAADAGLILQWSGPGIIKEVIPEKVLSAVPPRK